MLPAAGNPVSFTRCRRCVKRLTNTLPLKKRSLDKGRKHTYEYTIKVLEVHTSPNLFEDSRLDFILKSSGIDMGQFILDKIDKIEEEDLIY